MAYTAERTWVTGEVVTASLLNIHLRDNLKALASVGSYKFVADKPATLTGEVVYEGAWLLCNGAAVSRTTYAALNTWMAGRSPAYPFGAGDNSTTFNLPNLLDRAFWSVATSGARSTLGNSGGSDTIAEGDLPRAYIYDGAGWAFFTAQGSGTQLGRSPGGGAAGSKMPPYLVAGVALIKF